MTRFIEERQVEIPPKKLTRNKAWNESEDGIIGVTERILNTLEDTWNNLVFSLEFAESQNEGTYVTNVIVPAIRASLKNLPYGKSSFVSLQKGRVLLVLIEREGAIKFQERVYEPMYSEYSRLFCTEKKKR